MGLNGVCWAGEKGLEGTSLAVAIHKFTSRSKTKNIAIPSVLEEKEEEGCVCVCADNEVR